MKKLLISSLAVLTIGAAMIPSLAGAQSWHRQSQKDQWKDIAIGAGALGLIGALTHNDTLTFGGLAGAAYAAYRYDADGNCYGERWDRDHRHAEWIRVPDRDRRDSNRDRDSNRGRDDRRDGDRDRSGDRDKGRGDHNRDRHH